jgi:hypothetical protein
MLHTHCWLLHEYQGNHMSYIQDKAQNSHTRNSSADHQTKQRQKGCGRKTKGSSISIYADDSENKSVQPKW